MTTKRVALVTGSGKRRIGWHVAQALAERGYALAIHYRESAKDAAETVGDLEKRGIEAIAIGADLGDEMAVHHLVDETARHFGRLDVLVNCAGTWQGKRFEEVTAVDVCRSFETNTLGTFLCAQRAGLIMVKQPEGGNIINVGDWATARPYVNHAAYLASKGAIPTLTRTLAVELGSRNPNVRVNCILPGPVMLPESMSAEERRQSIDATLVKREGKPDNIAHAVTFLIENDFVTGVCLPVDGGRTIFSPDSV